MTSPPLIVVNDVLLKPGRIVPKIPENYISGVDCIQRPRGGSIQKDHKRGGERPLVPSRKVRVRLVTGIIKASTTIQQFLVGVSDAGEGR